MLNKIYSYFKFKFIVPLSPLRTKRLELLRNYFHSCLRGDTIIQDSIPGTLMDKIVGVSQLRVERPFGLLREITLKQTYALFQNFNISTVLNNHEVVLHPGYLISAALVYKITVNTFAKSVYPISTINTFTTEAAKVNWFKIREKTLECLCYIMPRLLLTL